MQNIWEGGLLLVFRLFCLVWDVVPKAIILTIVFFFCFFFVPSHPPLPPLIKIGVIIYLDGWLGKPCFFGGVLSLVQSGGERGEASRTDP